MALPDLIESAAEPEPDPAAETRPRPLRAGIRRVRTPRTPEPTAQPKPGPAAEPGVRRQGIAGLGAALSLLALLVLGFFAYLYGFSTLSEQRAQSVAYKTFAGELALATAPTGPTTEGAPVAILDIPRLGITDMVVVEGTTAEDLTHGPGHVRATVLPGQSGVSVIYGRVATYGGPFAHLMRLQRGDRITVITGQGTSTYVVESFGTQAAPAPDQTANRLLLVAGDSAGFPTGWVQVSADLASTPQAAPGGLPQVSAQEGPLAGNPQALIPLVFWAQALLLVSLAGSYAAHRWSRGAALLCTAPAALALVWAVYENLSLLLPNLY
jgi:sortase A